MGSMEGEEWENQSHDNGRIHVAVRVRPLSDKEIAKHDLSDWECINNNTIIFKNTLEDRSMLPTAYTFDRVFGFNSPTKHVYDQAAKKIALSVLSGINSTVFAYGQTGSGKTFTMWGITEYAIADIYSYIDKHRDRRFVLKFCAMEIYNEAVRDLLRTDATNLRLLDDPERGTIVANLTEVTLKDSRQLKELLSICEAQRKIGETSLNEVSSRSHQILRLTVESEAVHYLGEQSSSTLTASVNFVDLAGSERASQTSSAGTRLKEGCHINRSLLTLGTVIRKLSKGGKSGHIPYRDSKLTRILQTSLGGNARTAIICTMSPAHSHVEQSRNTLHFANCAKQVQTNAHVNVVMSEKALVKQLQKELAKMESELKNIQSFSHSGASKTALKEKELLIQKMDQEIRDLTYQRDMAQSRVENMLRSGGDQASKSGNYVQNQDRSSWTDEYAASEASEYMDPLRLDVVSRSSNSGRYEGLVGNNKIEDRFAEEQFLFSTMSPRLDIDKYFGPDPCQGMEKELTRRNSVTRKPISRTPSRNSNSTVTSKYNAPSPRDREQGVSPWNAPSPRYREHDYLSPRNRELGQSPRNRDLGLSPHNAPSARSRDLGLSSSNAPSAGSRELGLSSSNAPSARSRELGLSSSNAPSPRSRELGLFSSNAPSPRCRELGLSSSNAPSPRSRELGLSPRREQGLSLRNRERVTGRSLGSSADFEAAEFRARSERNCEAILAEIVKGSGREVAKENEKTAQIESVNTEKPSLRKTLAALMRENSRRFSDSKTQSYSDAIYEEYSPRLSDAKTNQSYSDSVYEEYSPRLSDAKTHQSYSDALSRDNSRKLSDVKTLSRGDDDALSRQTSRASAGRKYVYDEQNIESPTKNYAKQKEVSVKEVSKTQVMKHVESDLETAESKSKKEKASSCTEEIIPVKSKKERRSIGPEETAEGNTKKDNKLQKATVDEAAGSNTKYTEADWKVEFERRKREIIKLWDACHIPLVHRSYFCLLFKGDPPDAVYMEVEHRRLSFLRTEGKSTNNELPASPKALHREREMLSRRMLKKFNTKEREALFQKWGIDMKSKQRRQQLCRMLWTDTDNMEHINESAAIVAKLAGLKEAGQAPKEMFGLSFSQKQSSSNKAFSWKHPIPSII